MADKVHCSTVGDYFTLQRGTTYKSRLLGQPGPVLLGLATIQRNGGFRSDSLKTYGGECPDKLLVQPGELYVSLKDVTQSADLLGAIARLPSGFQAGRLTQDTVKLEPKRSDVPLDYIYWLLRTPQYRNYCRAHATGTTNLGLGREDFLSFPAPEPTPKQLSLVGTLGALDDKIELNRRINETLDEMAQVLFDHFFPYSTEDNLPDCWRVGRLDEVLVLQRGFDLPTPERLPGPYPVVAASGPSGTHNQFMVRGPGVTTGRSGILGNVYFVHEDFWPLNTSLWIKEFRNATPAYAYHLLLGLDFELFNAGSAVPTLNRNHVHNLPVVVPPMKRVKDFDRRVMPLLRRQKANHEESQTLAALRDTLLPKLLSGEIRLDDVEV
jgi:type I restriction enzyme S subunit